MSFDPKRPFGMVIVKVGCERVNGFIDIDGDFNGVDKHGNYCMFYQDDYQIIHDLRTPIMIGEECEFSHNQKLWVKGTLAGYHTNNACRYMDCELDGYQYIRPIQDEIEVTVNGEKLALSSEELDKIREVLA